MPLTTPASDALSEHLPLLMTRRPRITDLAVPLRQTLPLDLHFQRAPSYTQGQVLGAQIGALGCLMITVAGREITKQSAVFAGKR